MRADVMAKGLRLTTTATEAAALLMLVEGRSIDEAMRCDLRAALRPAIDGMSNARIAKAVKRQVARDQARKQDEMRDNRTIDGCSVISRLGDWVDVSRDPDRTTWLDLHQQEAFAGVGLKTHLPDQGEIRRDAWHVMVLNPNRDQAIEGYEPMFLGSDVTETGRRSEIEAVAQRIIAGRAA